MLLEAYCSIMKKVRVLAKDPSYWEAVEKTASQLGIEPEVVDKLIRRFWNGVINLTIFGLRKINICSCGTIKTSASYHKSRLDYLNITRIIYNRRTEESAMRQSKVKKRELLFTEYHSLNSESCQQNQ